MFQTGQDEAAQRSVAAILEKAWKCKAHSFGKLNPVDWWLERNDTIVGFAELKVRTHPSTLFDTVYLSVRKWLALQLTGLLGVRGLFVV